MKTKKKYYSALFIPLLIIMIISFFNMQNAKLIKSTYELHLLKQMLWYLLGFLLIIIVQKLNLKELFKYSFILYLLSIILLALVLVFGRTINGAKAWFSLGFLTFQPSELVKFTLALYLAQVISQSKIKDKKDELKLILKTALITFIPSLLVFLEPDTGAIIFYLLILISMLIFAPISKWWFGLLTIIFLSFLTTFTLLYLFGQELLIKLIGTSFFYRVERILKFTTNSSYQLKNALIVVGSAGLWGTGLNKISLYIPEAPTDFIFAFNIGNFGLLSGFLILLSYLVLDLFLIKVLKKITSKKIKLFVISFICLFLFQEVINIGMNLGLLPIIGIPLPFLSYGGSTIIIYFLFLAIILNFLKSEGANIY